MLHKQWKTVQKVYNWETIFKTQSRELHRSMVARRERKQTEHFHCNFFVVIQIKSCDDSSLEKHSAWVFIISVSQFTLKYFDVSAGLSCSMCLLWQQLASDHLRTSHTRLITLIDIDNTADNYEPICSLPTSSFSLDSRSIGTSTHEIIFIHRKANNLIVRYARDKPADSTSTQWMKSLDRMRESRRVEWKNREKMLLFGE